MKMPEISLIEWQKRYCTENACVKTLVKWFWAIYLMASDKGGISALRVAKHLDVSWMTARNMLRKIRKAMAHRDRIYRLANLIALDDTFVGGKHAVKIKGRQRSFCLG